MFDFWQIGNAFDVSSWQLQTRGSVLNPAFFAGGVEGGGNCQFEIVETIEYLDEDTIRVSATRFRDVNLLTLSDFGPSYEGRKDGLWTAIEIAPEGKQFPSTAPFEESIVMLIDDAGNLITYPQISLERVAVYFEN